MGRYSRQNRRYFSHSWGERKRVRSVLGAPDTRDRWRKRTKIAFPHCACLTLHACLALAFTQLKTQQNNVLRVKEEIKKREDKIVLGRIIRRWFFPKDHALHFSISKAMCFTTLKLNRSQIFVTFKGLIWVFMQVFVNPKFSLTLYVQNCSNRTRLLSSYCIFKSYFGFFHTSRVQYCCTQQISLRLMRHYRNERGTGAEMRPSIERFHMTSRRPCWCSEPGWEMCGS